MQVLGFIVEGFPLTVTVQIDAFNSKIDKPFVGQACTFIP